MSRVIVQKIDEDVDGNLHLRNSSGNFCSIVLVDCQNASSDEQAIGYAKSYARSILSLNGRNDGNYVPVRMFLSQGRNVKLSPNTISERYVIVGLPNEGIYDSLGISPSGSYSIKSI